ncbi:MAG: DUF2341 domain-containing protein [Pseudomonadota bacterium]
MKKIVCALLMSTAFFSAPSWAWWNGDWAHRAKITLKTAEGTGEAVADIPMLVRLHTGNFNFLDAREDGADMRFVAADDKTLLKYHIEKFDAVNELALVWVQLPALAAGKAASAWVYYGNDKAPAGAEAAGTYDAKQVLMYHFAEPAGAPQDVSANTLRAEQFPANRTATAVVGAGMAFNGAEKIVINPAPAIKFDSASGFTFSAWIKFDAPQKDAVLFKLQDGAQPLWLLVQGTKLVAAMGAGRALGGAMAPAVWHHIAITADRSLTVFVDGKEAGATDITMPQLQGSVIIGEKFKGDMDEVNIASTARSASWIALAAKGQSPDAALVTLGAAESGEAAGGNSYFGTILHSVTLDGWVVIMVLLVMAAISWMVMVSKALVIKKSEQGNREFLQAFHHLKLADTAKLDADDDQSIDADIHDSPVLMTLFGRHDHYQHAPVYSIYHAGVQEIKNRFNGNAQMPKNLSPQSIDAIRATLDASLVREGQKLNSLMVLLTIAISGGPFLGLLGTVVGVMITFAAIAATGDVNVAAIAPGIAAALVATVAGLVVAIPALFGYNYLASRIKNVSADMRVFADEFVARIAENYSPVASVYESSGR